MSKQTQAVIASWGRSFLAAMLNLSSAVFAIKNNISNFDIHWNTNAIIKASWSNCNNGAFLWLLFCSIWNNWTRCSFFFCFTDLDNDSIF